MTAPAPSSAIFKRPLPRPCLGLALLLAMTLPAWPQPEPITKAADLLALSAEAAKQARPVRLQGVVLGESAPEGRSLVIADDSAGVYVLAGNNILAPFHRGDLLSLTGVSDPGQFAPIVKVTAAKKIGTAPLPAPRTVSYAQLITGALDAQWVEITGVVQQYIPPAPGSKIRRLVVSVGGGPVHVRITDPKDPQLQEDAEVKIQALCFYQFNQKGQILNPVLQVPPGIPIKVIKPAPPEPFAAPIHSAASLLRFSPEASFGHRVHMRGVVTHSQSNSFVWIRDESAGLRLQVATADLPHPGDIIDVLGFPKFGSATPVLEVAIFSLLGKTNPPAPLVLTNPASTFDHEDNLVSLEATLNDVESIIEGMVVSLNANGTTFKGVLRETTSVRLRPDWQPGSRVRVTGICSVTYGDARPMMGIWHPQSFQLLLRSPADITILQAPPWWNLRRVTYLLGIVSGILMLATSAITMMAQRRLREQEQQRAMAEAEFAAILSERNRVAREIHDTLAQGLAATSVQLRLARKLAAINGEESARHLDTAQTLVRGSLEEARNTIWNMRSQVLETGDLPTALKNILKQMADGTELKSEFETTGRVRRLPPVIENNLLRLGQEAITNATKHAQAKTIRVALHFGEKQFQLSVEDDGAGFDAAHPPASEGGFGLVGMRERAKELKGELNIRSHAGAGTKVQLSVPLTGE